MIGIQPTGRLPNVVISAVMHEGLTVSVDGKPARLAVVLAGVVLTVGGGLLWCRRGWARWPVTGIVAGLAGLVVVLRLPGAASGWAASQACVASSVWPDASAQ